MTLGNVSPTQDFLMRLHKIDMIGMRTRDIILLWAIARDPGMMGLELARKLGYKSRSNIQDAIARLTALGLIEDRRVVIDKHRNRTPNDLHALPAGEKFLTEVVPQ